MEKVLDNYGIGCGPCSVGICQLKDIVDIHNLPQAQEQELMQKIAGMDRNLSPSRVDEISAKFNEVDEKTGFSPDKYLKFIEKLEMQFNA